MVSENRLNFVPGLMDVLDSAHYNCEYIIYENDTVRFWIDPSIDP